MMMEPVKDGLCHDCSENLWRIAARNALADSLMRPQGIIVIDVLQDEVAQLFFVEDDKIVERFSSNGADKAFGKRIHIGCFNGSGDAGDIVKRVSLIKFRRTIMDEVNPAFPVFGERNDGLTDKLPYRMPCQRGMNDSAGLEVNDEENIEAPVEERVDGKEIAGEKRFKVGLQKRSPGCSGFDFAFSSEILDD